MEGQRKILRKGLMLEGTNSRCPIFYYYFFFPKLAGEIAGQRNGTFSTVNQAVFLRRSSALTLKRNFWSAEGEKEICHSL